MSAAGSPSSSAPSIQRPSSDPGASGDVAAPLDLLLTDAALGPTRRFFPGVSGLRFTRALAGQPRLLAARVGGLAGELGRVVAGISQVAPSRRDRRFADPAWTHNPFLRRAVQAYLATTTTVSGLVEDVPLSTDLGLSPGAVVRRDPVYELIQYRPQTPSVRTTPLVIIPPTINKFYILDLAPGRSMVEYLLSKGQQVFVVSWRNPDARHSKWGAEAYCQAILDAVDTACDITGADTAQLLGTCSGGILASMVMGHLAQIGKQHRIAGFTLLVTLLDQAAAGTVGALADKPTAEAAIAASRARGYLDGRALAEVFAWLRPNDLIWNYWVNNYLQGKRPPAFDILYWNADTTRMTAALHHDFVRMALGNALTHPGGATVLGTEVDLSKVNVDSYIVAGSADHICPWQSCYRSTQLLGGTNRFVLSTNGHIAALVNPPTNPKSSYQTTADGQDNPADPQAWTDAAKTEPGSWWPNYDAWLADRSGQEKPSPEALGNARFTPLGPAPGSYVMDR